MTTDKKKNDQLTEPDGNDALNVREIHGAIMRELPDPVELYRNIPWWLRHTYVAMAIGVIFYLLVLAGDYDWQSFDLPLERIGILEGPAAEGP
jgi:hypothetical protein